MTTLSSPTEPASGSSATVTGRATRVGLVGSGFIADVHLQVLRAVPSVVVVALCDPQRTRAERLARTYGVEHVFASVDELLAFGGIDAVHVLVPPGLHAEVAEACLGAGLHVLVEKPLALRAEQVAALARLASLRQRVLAVNHNLTFHPALRRLTEHLGAGRLGRLEHVAIQHHVPLRQLQTGDVAHFMFQSEANILWEQGVHVFSMVFALLGACRRVRATTGARRALPNGVAFVEEWHLQLDCERGTAGVRLAFGRPMLETTLQAIGSDGAALLDLQRGTCWLRRKTRWLEFLDHARNLAAGAWHLGWRAIAAVTGYGLGLFRLAFPDDAFLRGMRGSLRAFHATVRGRAELPDAVSPAGARAVLEMCMQSAVAAGVQLEPPPAPPPLPAPGPARAGEVVVLGGTGFVGRRCVRLLQKAGRPITLVVRKPQLLPQALRDSSVRVLAGDAADPATLAAAFAGASRVLHLATAAGDDAGAVERVMAAAVREAGQAALRAGVGRFVYASSTAALWLGGPGTIDGAASPDPVPGARGAYARGKIAAERELRRLREQGLAATIVRPAIVVGDDGVHEHSGVGMWVRDNHCVGWGQGRLPLPFVLADDCAAGLVAALDAPSAAGKDYNLAGDVRLTAREYVSEMASRTGRDYHFHATWLWWMWLMEFGKYLVKLAARRPRQWPAYRDLASRSFRTVLDCSDARRDLGFQPEADRARFLQRVFDAPGPPGDQGR
ncbi:MAG TPA: Gfo/Idh/MocA family oxidoreductase [Planctomycetota bacterium]|nr:Gfo/Idh/MocA family oxidoreductase [Planctomycetota bacterium]